MMVDFFLFWTLTVNLIKAGIKGHVSAEHAGLMLAGAGIGLGAVRAFGSAAFRDRATGPKAIFSAGTLCFVVVDGDVELALYICALTLAPAIAAFGFYVMVKSAISASPK